jgi:hypothetical protein
MEPESKSLSLAISDLTTEIWKMANRDAFGNCQYHLNFAKACINMARISHCRHASTWRASPIAFTKVLMVLVPQITRKRWKLRNYSRSH